MSSLINSYDRVANSRKFPMQRPLTLDGTQTGNNKMNVDGSTTPVEFYFQADTSRSVHINKISFLIGDVTNSNFESYGSLLGPLTNGITLYSIIGGVEIPLNALFKRTADYLGAGAEVQFVELTGNTRMANYSLNLFEYSEGVILDGNKDEILGLRINDDLTSLDLHEAYIDGYFQIEDF
jgi:hypothetical protein